MSGPLPAATFPLPPPLGALQIVDPRTGRLTTLGLSFMTQLWAGIQGSGGTADQLAILFGMNGDATITSAGVITVTSTEGHALYPFPWQPQGYLDGALTASEVIFRLPTKAGNFLPAGLAGSLFNCTVAPTGDVVFDLQQNGVSFGSVTFAAGTMIGTVESSDVTFDDDDAFAMVAPVSPDATFAGLYFLFLGTRTQ